MTLYKQCLMFSIEGLIGNNSNLSQDSWLNNSLILSKMKVLYHIKQPEEKTSFDILTYLKSVSNNRNIYKCLTLEILYLLNFKKKFTQKNVNRIIDNYFKIVSCNLGKKANLLTVPEQIIEDQKYVTTLALSSLYAINQFYYEEETI